MSLAEMAALVLTFNLLTFGNGPVMVPLLQRGLVQDAGLMTIDQFLYAFAVGRVTPGPANLYVSAIGYMAYGWLGAIATTAAILLPGYLMLPLVRFYERFRDNRAVRDFTRALASTSIGLVLATTIEIGRDTLTSGIAWVVFALTLVLVQLLRWNALLAMGVASIGGLVLKLMAG